MQGGVSSSRVNSRSRSSVLPSERRRSVPGAGQQAGGASSPVARQRLPQVAFVVAAAPALLQQPAAPAYRWRRFLQNPSYQEHVLFQSSHLVGKNQYRIHVDASKVVNAQLVSNQSRFRNTRFNGSATGLRARTTT